MLQWFPCWPHGKRDMCLCEHICRFYDQKTNVIPLMMTIFYKMYVENLADLTCQKRYALLVWAYVQYNLQPRGRYLHLQQYLTYQEYTGNMYTQTFSLSPLLFWCFRITMIAWQLRFITQNYFFFIVQSFCLNFNSITPHSSVVISSIRH